MSKQSEALRLANWLENKIPPNDTTTSMNHASMKHLSNLIKNGWIESAQELIDSALAQPEHNHLSDAMRLYQAVDRLATQAGEDASETIDWLCGEHGGMYKLFEAYFSPKPLANPLANQAETSGSPLDSADSAETFGKTEQPDLRKAADMALEALDGLSEPYDVVKAKEALRQALAQPEQEPVVTDKDGSPCPEFWDWLPKAYNFEGNGTFTKYNMEVAFLAGKNTALAQPKHPMRSGQKLLRS